MQGTFTDTLLRVPVRIHILSIFPELFGAFTRTSLIGKAAEKGLLEIKVTDPRDFADAPHFHVDDYPYGGGPGMVMKAEPLAKAIEAAKNDLPGAKVLLLSASGLPLTQPHAGEISALPSLILICGRYEGVDQRIIDLFVDEEISIGDAVYMGGEVPAMALIEAVTRFLPDVIGNAESLTEESFSERPDGISLLEGPQYTRPEVFRGMSVPDVLLSGDHARIHAWRVERALEKTLERRPEIMKGKKKS